MTIIVCVDDNMGMMFNDRRQSRDSAVIDKIYEIAQGGSLFASEYSANLFDEEKVIVCNEMLDRATDNDYCFVENISLCKHMDKIKSIVLFKWNRSYPYDVKLDISIDEFTEVLVEDFAGNSHEKITKAVYVK